MLNWILLGLAIWGVVDVISGLKLLFWRTPILLLGKIFTPKRPQIGYTKDELERIFQLRNPMARKNAEGQWVDENDIPYLM